MESRPHPGSPGPIYQPLAPSTHPSSLPCSLSLIRVLSGGASCLVGRPGASARSQPRSHPAQSPHRLLSAPPAARAGPGPRYTLWGQRPRARPYLPHTLPSVPTSPLVLPGPQGHLGVDTGWGKKAPACVFQGGSPSTSTWPSVTRARAAATESASCTSSCNVSREPGGHPRDWAASHSGPCLLRSRSVAYTGGWGRG